ncbi:MAG: DUF6128 domain-containing protein [Fusicatenibacter sp.]|nr:DUF6128 domain-containing protein [Fusicatenibacter sp.]
MSDYRRFIAYLYEYLNNQKGPNCGFVRVEVQNGFCRMDFQIKGIVLPPEHLLFVYGFIRRDQKLYGIPLGELVSGRSNIAGKLFTRTDSLGHSRYSLNDLGGLLLTGKDQRIFATQWDDLPILPQTFTPSLPESSSVPAPKAAAPETESLPVKPSEPAHDTSVKEEKDAPPTASRDLHIASVEQTKATDTDRPVSDPKPQVPGSSVTLSSGFGRLQAQLSAFYPFSDDELTDCLRMEPKDLPLLRTEGFQADDNPFLLHGFHNYHHLLLARSPEQNLCVLGVPGIYNANEQFMASLFGYYRFKQAKRPPELAPQERFGYWYKYLPEAAQP